MHSVNKSLDGSTIGGIYIILLYPDKHDMMLYISYLTTLVQIFFCLYPRQDMVRLVKFGYIGYEYGRKRKGEQKRYI